MKRKEFLILIAAVLLIGTGVFSMALKSAAKTVGLFSSLALPKASNKTIVTDTVELSGFDKLDIDVASINTYVETGDSYKLEYKVYEDNIPEISENGGHLKIKQPGHDGIFRFHIGIFEDEEQLYKLTVPKDAGILDVDLKAASGKISVDDVDVKGKIGISSGKIELKDVTSEELKLTASSGNVEASNLELDNLRLKITSGNLNVSDCTTKDLDAHMTSGNMDIDNIKFDKANIKLTSGTANIDVAGSENDYSYDLDSTSGSMKIGDKRIKDKYRFGDDKGRLIKADMTSGNLNISFSN